MLLYLQKVMGPDKVSLMTVGVDVNLIKPIDKLQARREIGLKSSSHVICYIGHAYELKGVDYLLNSFIFLKEEGINMELLLVGVRESDPLRARALEYGARVFGFVPKDRIPIIGVSILRASRR
jgi:glycosyltransferase involved in cell wall biosynthesis